MADEAVALLKEKIAELEKTNRAFEKELAALKPKAELADTLGRQVGELTKAQKDLAAQHEAALAKVQAEHVADRTFADKGIADPTWVFR